MTAFRERIDGTFSGGIAVDRMARDFRLRAGKGETTRYKEGLVRTFDIQPLVPTYPSPIALIQGWGVNEPKYRNMMAIAQTRRALTFHTETSRGQGKVKPDSRYSVEDVRKARLVNRVLDEKGVDSLDGIAISGGSPVLLLAAYMEPKRFKNIVLITPPLTIPLEPTELMRRFLQQKRGGELHLGDKLIDPTVTKITTELVGHVFRNPGRAWREIKGICETDLYALAQKVSEDANISVLAATEDNVFRLSEIEENFSRKRMQGAKFPFSGLGLVPGGHSEATPYHTARIEKAVEVLSPRRHR